MTTWTVVGYYDGDGNAFAAHAEADDAFEAMAVTASRYEHEDLVIVGAVPGKHQLVTPGDDSGSTAYAVDMAALLDSDEESAE